MVDPGESMDEGVVVDGGSLVVVVADHGLESYHFHEDHTQAEDICFGGYVRIVIGIFQFLCIYLCTFSNSGARYKLT